MPTNLNSCPSASASAVLLDLHLCSCSISSMYCLELHGNLYSPNLSISRRSNTHIPPYPTPRRCQNQQPLLEKNNFPGPVLESIPLSSTVYNTKHCTGVHAVTVHISPPALSYFFSFHLRFSASCFCVRFYIASQTEANPTRQERQYDVLNLNRQCVDALEN